MCIRPLMNNIRNTNDFHIKFINHEAVSFLIAAFVSALHCGKRKNKGINFQLGNVKHGKIQKKDLTEKQKKRQPSYSLAVQKKKEHHQYITTTNQRTGREQKTTKKNRMYSTKEKSPTSFKIYIYRIAVENFLHHHFNQLAS